MHCDDKEVEVEVEYVWRFIFGLVVKVDTSLIKKRITKPFVWFYFKIYDIKVIQIFTVLFCSETLVLALMWLTSILFSFLVYPLLKFCKIEVSPYFP